MVSLSMNVLKYRSQLLSEIKDGTAKECFATHLYENRIEYGLNDHETMFAGPAVPCPWTDLSIKCD